MGNSLLIRIGIVGLALTIAGIAMLVSGAKDKAAIAKGVQDLTTLSVSDFEKGRFYEGQLDCIIDEFAYETTTRSSFGVKTSENVSNHYYLVPISLDGNAHQYVTLEVGNDEFASTAEKMIDELWDEDNEEFKSTTTVYFRGKAKDMDGEVRDLLYETYDLLYEGMNYTAADYDKMTVPYTLTYTAPGYESRGSVVSGICLAVGLVLVAVTVFLFIQSRKEQPMDYGDLAPVSGTFDKTSFSGIDNVPAQAPAQAPDSAAPAQPDLFPRETADTNTASSDDPFNI
ncbi:MAG: hypothetical protein IJ080_00200 [Oscillospiraceae bacterium]|nr:hypothetical protein [Oscillospiraceae bacterium]